MKTKTVKMQRMAQKGKRNKMAKKLVKIDKSGSERRYSVQVVSQAIGLSEGAISGYFNNQGISVVGGITAKQVIELVEWRSTGRKYKEIDWNEVKALLSELRTLGYEVADVNEEDE